MRAVVFGAGRIGCGFAGDLLRASGYDVTVVGRSPAIEHLAAAGRYVVRLVDRAGQREHVVDAITAVDIADRGRVRTHVAQAAVVATAVGPANLGAVVPFLAERLAERRGPVNVIAFENLADAGAVLQRALVAHAGPDRLGSRWGCSGAVVSRAVAHRILGPGPGEPPVFVGDPPRDFQVARATLCDPVPHIEGMQVVADHRAWIHRKLYLYSAGHAATAYLGHLKGYHYVHSAIRDPEIRVMVRAAMVEGQHGLRARYGPAVAGDVATIDAILARFDNAALGDRIDRVGRDPRRKLAADDRLIGAARLAVGAGVAPTALALAAAAAFCFADAADEGSVGLREEVERHGIEPLLARVCRLEPSHGIGRAVVAAWLRLAAGWSNGNRLLRIDAPRWAWSERGVA